MCWIYNPSASPLHFPDLLDLLSSSIIEPPPLASHRQVYLARICPSLGTVCGLAEGGLVILWLSSRGEGAGPSLCVGYPRGEGRQARPCVWDIRPRGEGRQARPCMGYILALPYGTGFGRCGT